MLQYLVPKMMHSGLTKFDLCYLSRNQSDLRTVTTNSFKQIDTAFQTAWSTDVNIAITMMIRRSLFHFLYLVMGLELLSTYIPEDLEDTIDPCKDNNGNDTALRLLGRITVQLPLDDIDF